MNLQESWTPYKPVFEMAVNGLEFCAERLQANSPETVIEPGKLDEIREQVEKLLAKVKSSGTLPVKLRYAMFDLLVALRRAIDEYQIRGTHGLRREMFLMVAQLEENWELVVKNQDDEEVKGFFKILRQVDKVTAVAARVKELVAPAAPYLPLLVQGVEHFSKSL